MSTRTISIALLTAVLVAGCSGSGNFGLGGGPESSSGPSGVDLSAQPIYDQDSPEYFAHSVGDRVFFEVDQSTITEESALVLRQQAEWLNANPTYFITIEGHADEQGTREYNLALGARRASAVKDFLVEVGISSHRISMVTYGKERPVAACSNESCWSQNRRSVTLLNRELTG